MISLVLPSRDTYDHGAVDTPPVGRRFPGSRRVDLLVLAGLAVAAFAVQGLAWPLAPGRDVQSYLTYYLEMGSADPVFPQNMLLRTPLAPLFNGLALDLGGTVAAEALMGVLYVAAVLATYLIGSFWSRSAGLASGLTILLYPGYGAMFHQVSSDALFAFGLVVWAVFICRTAASPTGRKFALNGLALFLLVMIRPPAALLLPVFAAFPFLVGGRMRERLRNATVFLVTAGALLAGWAGYNDLRYGDFTISRLSAAQLPLYRALEVDRIVDPGNGPASRDLARALETDLLRREPYKSYGITLDEFLQVANGGWSDLPSLSDRTWGWHKGYGKLRAVALEAIARHPVTYARGVVNTVRQQLTAPFFPPAPQAPPPPRTIECEFRCAGPGLKHINGRLLPAPVEEGELVPHHFAFWHESTPDNSIRTDWSSFARPKLVFKHPDVEARYERLAAELREMMSKLPSRDGSRTWSARLNTITGRLPSMLVWLALGILGVALRPQRQPRLLILLAMLGLAVVVGTALGSPSAALYRLPTDPLYIVFGLAALVGSGPGVRPWVKRFVRPRRGLGHTSVGAR